MSEFDSTPWVVGWVSAGVVVVVVAVLAMTLIGLASGIRRRVEGIFGALEEVRDSTASLWRLEEVNRALRERLGGEDVGSGAAP